MTTTPRWVDLDGTANTRDVGGLPVAGGGHVRPHVLLRSDNLQDLTPADARRLVGDIGLRTVVDVRTDAERRGTGPAPLDADPRVEVWARSLIVEDAGVRLDPGAVLPDRWADGAAGAYLHYLQDIPTAVTDAVRVIARSPGATVVHCAAGKDRTGTVTAVALAAVGVPAEEIVADYGATNERIEGVYARLLGSSTYREDVARLGLDAHRVEAGAMATVLAALDDIWGGAEAYLVKGGLDAGDLALLRQRLVDA